ncbi:MAG: glycosyltransferase [Deltaproteobacteria bacterium]|nr:glycosyltransferase [Deltaproteobacteria bacterium]
MKTASVIIDNYNYGHFLRKAIDSVLEQKRIPEEIIVVDDGSTDNSAEIIRSYGDRVIPVFKENGGHGSAFNAGFRRASGDAIFFLDADDAMKPLAIDTVLRKWKPGVVMVHYYMQVIDAQGKPSGVYPSKVEGLADGHVVSQLLETGAFPTTLTSGLAFSRDALDKVFPIDETVFRQAADGYLVRAVGIQGPVQTIDQCLAIWTRHGANDSRIAPDYDGMLKSIRRQMMYMKNELGEVPRLAKQFGYEAPARVEDRNLKYLYYRLISLTMDPVGHPISDDSSFSLWKMFCQARLKESRPFTQKITGTVLASLVFAAPASLSIPIVRFRMVSDSRPDWVKTIDRFRRYLKIYHSNI